MQKIQTLLKTSDFQQLATRDPLIEKLEAAWQHCAPAHLQAITRVKIVQNGVLYISAQHGVAAAKVKLLSSSLLIQLKNNGCEVTAIQVKVQAKSKPIARVKKPKILSPYAASRLNQLAAQMPNTALGESLAKLAKKQG